MPTRGVVSYKMFLCATLQRQQLCASCSLWSCPSTQSEQQSLALYGLRGTGRSLLCDPPKSTDSLPRAWHRQTENRAAQRKTKVMDPAPRGPARTCQHPAILRPDARQGTRGRQKSTWVLPVSAVRGGVRSLPPPCPWTRSPTCGLAMVK